MDVINECLSMAKKIGASIEYLSNGWLCLSKNEQCVYYERLSELYSDLSTGIASDYLLCVC